jgi:hypothetical protein
MAKMWQKNNVAKIMAIKFFQNISTNSVDLTSNYKLKHCIVLVFFIGFGFL